jgi:hypothetical protein
MTLSRPLFPNAVRLTCGLVALGGGALLAGCVGNPFATHPVDPASPVAAEVAQLSRKDGKFPTFASIPNAPKDVRPAPQYGRAAASISAAGQALIAATEPSTWTLQGTDEFAEKARRDAGPALQPANPAEADAFAKALRERATPPPPR